jgi:hypothetical protein
MKKSLKITAIIVGAILILMILLPLAFRGKLESIVKTEGNKMLNAQFDFKSLNISLFRNFPKASVALEGFWLKGTGTFENDTLISAGEIAATIDLLSLFGNSGYDISKISLKDIRAKAIVLPDGQVNWDVMKADSASTEEETTQASSPFKIQLRRLAIDNLNIVYDDRQANMYAGIQNLEATCAGDLGSDRTTLKLESNIESLTFKMNGIPFLNKAGIYAKMDIDADLANNKYTLAKNELHLNAIKAGIDGWVALKDPAMEMDLTLVTGQTGFKEILSLIPAIYAKEFESLKTDGTATLAAQAKGVMQGDTLPQFEATLEVKNAMFRYPSLPAGVDQINIRAEIKNPGGHADLTEIHIQPFNFRMAGNAFGLTADIKTPVSDPSFKAQANGVLNLGKIKDVYPLENMELNGVIDANLSVAGRMSYAEKEQYDKFQASGTLKVSDMKLQMKDLPDITIHKSLLTFTPQYLQLNQTTVNIGQNDMTADSRFENYIAYALQGKTLKGNLNIQSNHFNLNDFMGGAEDSTAMAATDTTAMSAFEIPKNINFTLTANMKEVLMNKMSFNNINGNLTVKDGKADMRNLSMNTMGGNVVMNGYYSTANPKKPELNAGFAMTGIGFAQAYKDLDMVRQLAPLFENLKGNFSGNINIQTDLDAQMNPVLQTTQGNGSLSTKDIDLSGVNIINRIADAANKPDLKNITVKDMSIDFTIKDGRVATKPFDIKWKGYNLNLSGTTGLDQTMAYKSKIQLPPSTGVGKYTTIDLKINGPFTSPTISIDTESMAKQAADVLKDQALEKLGEKLGLDSTQTADKEELKKQVKEKATEKVLDFLKKKLK